MTCFNLISDLFQRILYDLEFEQDIAIRWVHPCPHESCEYSLKASLFSCSFQTNISELFSGKTDGGNFVFTNNVRNTLLPGGSASISSKTARSLHAPFWGRQFLVSPKKGVFSFYCKSQASLLIMWGRWMSAVYICQPAFHGFLLTSPDSDIHAAAPESTSLLCCILLLFY